MENPRILVIDDSQTIRKMVECHLSQAGYRVVLAADAHLGLQLAKSERPNLILLDHQLPGVTGDEVCRSLLENPETASIPVVVCSAMRNRAYAQYTEFPNVVDQIPKPFTPDLLKGGVANALATGALVVQAQATGSALPDVVGEPKNAAIEGTTSVFPLRAILDFLNNSQVDGRLTLEVGKDRVRFALAAGRIQAVYSPTIDAARLVPYVPAQFADIAPLLSATIGEHQDTHMSGIVRLLEKSLSDPRRLRGLLRFQSAVLTYWSLAGERGNFAFEPGGTLPPMFQAFPLQISLPALAVDGAKLAQAQPPCESDGAQEERLGAIYARLTPRGGNLDRAGLSAAEMKLYTILDGMMDLATIARNVGLDPEEAAAIASGLELVGLVERRLTRAGASVLVLEEDPETISTIQRVLGPEGENYQLKFIRDRVGANLLLRRSRFELVLSAFDHAEHEAFFRSIRDQVPAHTRFVGILGLQDEAELSRLDAIGLDGILHRPLTEGDLRATVNHLLIKSRELVGAA